MDTFYLLFDACNVITDYTSFMDLFPWLFRSCLIIISVAIAVCDLRMDEICSFLL